MANYRTEKRYAMPGELIIVTAPLSNVVKQGEIFLAETVDGRGHASVNSGVYWVSPEEYEVLPDVLSQIVPGLPSYAQLAKELGVTRFEIREGVRSNVGN